MDVLPDAFPLPPTEVFVHRLPRREILGQVTPDATIVDLVEDSVEDFSLIDLTFAASTCGRRGQEGANHFPFLVTQISAIALGSALAGTTEPTRLEA